MKSTFLLTAVVLLAIPLWVMAVTLNSGGSPFAGATGITHWIDSGSNSNATIEAADFDDDGFGDLIVIDATWSSEEPSFPLTATISIQYFGGIGDGSWQTPIETTVEYLIPDELGDGAIYFVAIGSTPPPGTRVTDVNADGKLDIVVAMRAYAHGDRGRRGGYSSADFILTLLNTGGTGFRCVGDVDGNGQTMTADLLSLLEDWGCHGGDKE